MEQTLSHHGSNSENHGNKSFEMFMDDIDPLVDDDNIYDMIGMKSTLNLNDSHHSILTDLDGLENEQSLLEDLLYGGDTGGDHGKRSTTSNNFNNKKYSHNKPPTGRSRSPSLTRVGGSSNRSRSAARSRSVTRSIDSDTASRVSFDMLNSDVDDSENGRMSFTNIKRFEFLFFCLETHDEEELSIERIQLLNYVRTARIRIDHLRLNILNGRESPSSFGRTNKTKRAM